MNLIELVAGALLLLGSFLILRAVLDADRRDRRVEPGVREEAPAEERRAA